MTTAAQALIVALRSDRHGCVGALVGVDGQLIATARARHPRLRAWAGFQAVTADAVLAAFHEVLGDLGSACQRRAPVAIGIVSVPPTALFVSGENTWLSPVMFGEGMPLPGRQVPSDFADPAAARLFRNSVVRQVEEREPDAVIGIGRVVSLGALLNRELTGYWVDSIAGRPTSAPWSGRGGYLDDDPMAWHAVGMDRRLVPDLVPPGGIMAQLSPRVASRYGWTAGTPLIATGDALACAAYGLASDAAAWVVELGDGVRAGWVGPTVSTASESLSVQIVDAPAQGSGVEPDAGAGEDAPETSREVSAEDATWLVAQRLGELAEATPGPRQGLSSYQMRTVEGLFEPDAGPLWRDSPLRLETSYQPLVGPQMLERAPLGCDGVRMMVSRTSATWVGLRPGHTDAYLVRAALEGLALELGRWRMTAGVLGADRPRLIVRRPWTSEAAQWVADIVGEPVLIWSGEPELPSLLGQALAMIRNLNLDDRAQPSVSVHEVVPGGRSEHYQPQRAVHLALMDALAAVI